jgi:hypothetical protein
MGEGENWSAGKQRKRATGRRVVGKRENEIHGIDKN